MFELFHIPGVAAVFVTLTRVIATVTFLALLHDLVATEWTVVFLEAILLALVAEHRLQHRADVVHRTVREFVVVLPLPTGGRTVHDEVAHRASRPTIGRVVMR